ncbi:MAG: hypothetical protein WBA57_10635 [Elainellaceae cyanobacterium]
MHTQSSHDQSESAVDKQPLTPEEVTPEQRQSHHDAIMNENPTVNPGDRVQEDKSLKEKAQQVAVNTADITGEHVVVPTYFVVDGEDGDQKALHHVKDAEEISDVIRQARTDEDGDRTWQ